MSDDARSLGRTLHAVLRAEGYVYDPSTHTWLHDKRPGDFKTKDLLLQVLCELVEREAAEYTAEAESQK